MDFFFLYIIGAFIGLYLVLLRLGLLTIQEATDRLFQESQHSHSFQKSHQELKTNNKHDKKIQDLNILVNNLVTIAEKESTTHLLESNYDSASSHDTDTDDSTGLESEEETNKEILNTPNDHVEKIVQRQSSKRRFIIKRHVKD